MLEKKTLLRTQFKAIRDGILPEEQTYASTLLVERFMAQWPLQTGHIIAGYYPIGSELSPLPLLTACAKRGAVIALPRISTQSRQLEFVPWHMEDGISYSNNIPQPISDSLPTHPHYILVPFLAVDKQHHRLGYGGGYYDYTLAHILKPKPVTIGIGFHCQQLAILPHDSHDIVLDHILLL